MEKYTQIQFGERSKNNNRDVVFIWIYARDCTPYDGYDDPLVNNPVVNMVLGQVRWDGLFGASAGGTCDKNESIYQSLIREVQEELNYDITNKPVQELCTLKNGNNGFHIHSYKLEVQYDELKSIRNNAIKAKHYEAEVSGLVMIPCAYYTKHNGAKAGLENILKQQFVSSSKNEFMLLMDVENLIKYF